MNAPTTKFRGKAKAKARRAKKALEHSQRNGLAKPKHGRQKGRA